MQRPDDKKRQAITATAARLFATRPFHKVRLDDIAAAARIGKGTLYVYFDNKEDLYFSLIYDAFAGLVGRLKEQPPEQAPADGLRRIVGELVSFAFRHPYFYELTRAVGTASLGRASRGGARRDWDGKRRELQGLIEQTLRRGVRRRSGRPVSGVDGRLHPGHGSIGHALRAQGSGTGRSHHQPAPPARARDRPEPSR